MPIPILMPALSPTMTDGTLAKWLKQTGDTVVAGDIIAEIETDKATMEVEAVDEGKIGKILIEEGAEAVAINTPIALLLAEGEGEADLENFELPQAATSATAPQASAEPVPQVSTQSPSNGAESPTQTPTSAPVAAPVAMAAPSSGERIFASPLARRLAAQQGIDLSSVTGSGPHGRIVKIDIENYTPGSAGIAGSRVANVPITGDAPFALQPHTNMRKVIAARLTQSKQTVPHFYLTVDMEIDRLLDARKQINTGLENESGGAKISVNDFVIMAAAKALIDVPAANASWSDEGTRLYSRADVSVAVAIEGGLITPVVRGANQKTLKQISSEMKDLSSRARDGKLQPDEYQGGTISISNLGMFGIREFAAVINPPQGSILAVGTGEQRPVVRDGALAVATVMTCTLSCDHRAVDGAVGSELLVAFKKYIENPLAMLA
jgi:pyruvate dehydrogenase E2 component (dihydrolipoamide acetyltransferase)